MVTHSQKLDRSWTLPPLGGDPSRGKEGTTPGSFALPAVNVSDMYAPRIHGRSAMGRVDIAPR